MEGILIIDKPAGLTSHDVVSRVRRLAGQRRVGHSGTLDPLATGVLVLCLGRATRLVEYLTGLPKHYEGTVRLGFTTSTYDAEGEKIPGGPVPALSPADLEPILDRFRGPIEQVPPIYSAIKQDGRPLYQMARRGEAVAAPPRAVTIYRLEVRDWTAPDLQIRVECSAGTYIRSLAHDIGQALGCGGYLAALRRTAVGAMALDRAVPLDDLSPETLPEHLLPPEAAVAHLPTLSVAEAEAEALIQGRSLPIAADHPAGDRAAVFTAGGRFLGILARRETTWHPEKMFPPLPNPNF